VLLNDHARLIPMRNPDPAFLWHLELAFGHPSLHLDVRRQGGLNQLYPETSGGPRAFST